MNRRYISSARLTRRVRLYIYIYIYEEANNPRCLMLYDMACKMAGVVDALNIQEIEFCPVYHPYLPQFLQLFLLK